jgi:sporulation protein YlmC with PRC-barrel domain
MDGQEAAVELSQCPGAFSELVGMRVRDQAGRSLGRVFEVRAHWEHDGTVVLDELMAGGRALWRRLRGPDPNAHGIAWANVVEIDDERITVHPSG